MIALTAEFLRPFIAQARLAPSVHNIQPSRWRIEGDRLQLLGDPSRTIPVADPTARDWRLSHGAHLQGLSLALAAKGLAFADFNLHAHANPAGIDGYARIADFQITPTSKPSTQAERVNTRASWRGAFAKLNGKAELALQNLATERNDCMVISGHTALGQISALYDQASLFFLRDDTHRKELLSWMRLSRRHVNYHTDGLNTEAMQMSALEALGAGLVLGPLFKTLDRIRLAKHLVSEASKTKSAAAIVLFHRPAAEDVLESGREFYSVWLAMERLGLQGCPVSVLVDWSHSRNTLRGSFGVPDDRNIISAFRVGIPSGTVTPKHARLPVEALIV